MNKAIWTTAAAGFAAVLLVGLSGCPHDEYVVEMWPGGQQLERKVVIKHIDDKDRPSTTQVSTDRITEVIPDQLDANAGWYAVYPSEFGTAYFYSERIRGNDDQAGALEAQFKAVDRLIDMLLGWTKQEFGKLDEYPKLAAFIDKDLRKDLKNVGVIAFMADAGQTMPPVVGDTRGPGSLATQSDRKPDLCAAAARVVQYAAERNYLAKGDLGRLLRAVQDGNEGFLKSLLRDLFTRKVGLTEKCASELVKRLVQSAADKAFQEYARKSSHYAQALAEWEARQKAEKTGKASPPEATSQPQEPDLNEVLFTSAFANLAALINLGVPDDFRFTLHAGQSPLFTNGFYDAKDKTIAWAFRFPKANVGVPQVCYAVWVEPNEKAQVEHLGRVSLLDQTLAEYCLWRSALSKTESAEWSALLTKLKPGADCELLLKNAKFSGSDKQMHGAELIWNAIKPPETSTTQPALRGKEWRP
jgi:hypothetical protein